MDYLLHFLFSCASPFSGSTYIVRKDTRNCSLVTNANWSGQQHTRNAFMRFLFSIYWRFHADKHVEPNRARICCWCSQTFFFTGSWFPHTQLSPHLHRNIFSAVEAYTPHAYVRMRANGKIDTEWKKCGKNNTKTFILKHFSTLNNTRKSLFHLIRKFSYSAFWCVLCAPPFIKGKNNRKKKCWGMYG